MCRGFQSKYTEYLSLKLSIWLQFLCLNNFPSLIPLLVVLSWEKNGLPRCSSPWGLFTTYFSGRKEIFLISLIHWPVGSLAIEQVDKLLFLLIVNENVKNKISNHSWTMRERKKSYYLINHSLKLIKIQ